MVDSSFEGLLGSRPDPVVQLGLAPRFPDATTTLINTETTKKPRQAMARSRDDRLHDQGEEDDQDEDDDEDEDNEDDDEDGTGGSRT